MWLPIPSLHFPQPVDWTSAAAGCTFWGILGCAARQLRCDSSTTPKGDSKLNLVRKRHGNLVLLVVLIVPAFIVGVSAFFCLASCSTNCLGCPCSSSCQCCTCCSCGTCCPCSYCCSCACSFHAALVVCFVLCDVMLAPHKSWQTCCEVNIMKTPPLLHLVHPNLFPCHGVVHCCSVFVCSGCRWNHLVAGFKGLMVSPFQVVGMAS